MGRRQQVSLRLYFRGDLYESPADAGILPAWPCMNYEKMKALLEASREELAVQCNPKLEEIPAPDSRPDRKYLDYSANEQMAA